MNKGIIIEVCRGYSIVLAEGTYLKVRNKKNMYEGMEILFTEEDMLTNNTQITGIRHIYRYATAAVFAVVMLLSLTYYNYNMAIYAVVTIDINPSLQISLNRQNEVIRIEAMNKDGEDLLDAQVMGLQVAEAIEVLIDEADIEGYIDDEDDTFIVVTAVPVRSMTEDRIEDLKAEIAAQLEDDETEAEITFAVMDATKEELAKARDEEKPLPLVALQNKEKAKNAETVKELSDDQEALQEMAEEGHILRNQYGRSEERRNDLNVIKDKLTDAEDGGQALEFYEEAYEDYEEGFISAKDLKDLGKALLDDLKVQEDEEDNEASYSEGFLEALVEKIQTGLVLLPEGTVVTTDYGTYDQAAVETFLLELETAIDGVKISENGDDKALQEEGNALVKALNKMINNSDAEDSNMDESQGNPNNQGGKDQGNKAEDTENQDKGNQGQGNSGDKDNSGNNGKNVNDVEDSSAEDTEADEDADNSTETEDTENNDGSDKEDNKDKENNSKDKEKSNNGNGGKSD